MSQANESSFASPEDEDLFDFPAAPNTAPGGGLGGVFGKPLDDLGPEVSLDDVLPEPDTELQLGEADTEAHEAEAGDALEGDPIAQEQATPEFDLDEDLFAFDELFEETLPLATEEDLAALTEQYERELADSNRGNENPSETAATPKKKSKKKSTGKKTNANSPQVTPSSTPPEGQKTAGTASIDGAIPDHLWAPPPALVGAEPKRGRLLEVLAISFLVLNTGLILMAWRAGDNFQDTLASVTRTVTDAVADGHAKGQMTQPVIVSAPSTGSAPVEPAIESTDIEVEPAQDREQFKGPTDLLDLPRAALGLAEERVRKGLYADARRGLANLLANRDRTALSDEMVIEAEAMIAESYAIQAMEVNQ